MRIGETTDPVFNIPLKVVLGSLGTEYPHAESVKLLTYIDGTDEIVDYGARKERTAEFEFVHLTRANYLTLTDYLAANVGTTVKFVVDSAGENPFAQQALLFVSVFYATVIEWQDLGREDFSVSDSLYSVRLKIAYVGMFSNSVPNAANTSKYDILVEIDTVRAFAVATDSVNLPGYSTVTGGEIGYTTSDRGVWIFNGTSRTWNFLYTCVADNTAYGLVRGVFYLSSFADVTAGQPGIGSNTWKAGILNKESVQFPTYGMDIAKGPTVERLEGFSFSLNNVDQFWNFVVANKINFFGARVRLYVYDRANSQRVLLRTGFNYRNTFDYTNYTFEVEPVLLNDTKSFPEKTLGEVYEDAALDLRESPVIATFGRWEKGELQPVNFTVTPQRFLNGVRFIRWVSGSGTTIRVNIASTEFSKIAPSGGSSFLYLRVRAQDGIADVGLMKRITDFDFYDTDVTVVTISSAFPNNPDTTTVFEIYKSDVRLIADDEKIVGFRANGYIREDAAGPMPLELYVVQDDGDIETTPDQIYSVIDSNENAITIQPDFLDVDNVGTVTLKTQAALTVEKASLSHNLIDEKTSDYRYFNFGFNPEGPPSTEVSVTPRTVIGFSTGGGRVLDTLIQDGREPGKPIAAFSGDKVTIIWSPYPGATAYRLVRWKYKKKTSTDRILGIPVSSSSSTSWIQDRLISGISNTTTHYVDNVSLVSNADYDYIYSLQALLSNGEYSAQQDTEGGKVETVPSGYSGLFVRSKDSGATLAWRVPSALTEVRVYQDGSLIQTLTGTNATNGYLNISGLNNDQVYRYKISMKTNSIGSSGDIWYLPFNISAGNIPYYLLKQTADSNTVPRYSPVIDRANSNTSDPLLSYAVTVKNTLAAYGTFHSASVVYFWVLRLDHTQLPDLSNAKDVRLLTDFVIRSYYTGDYDADVAVPIVIQMRGLKAKDGSTAFLVQYENMTTKKPPDGGSYGAYARFRNLPTSKGGADSNYDTNSSSPNADGTYTGKDLWRIPDYVFEDNAFEWKQVDYIVFSITNNDPVPADYASAASKGYRIGIGGPPGKSWSEVTSHKKTYYLEYVKEYEGGLSKPQYARIDGGVTVADSAVTGTGSEIIVEKAKHVTNYVIKKMLGTVPTYIGNETRGRDNWIWRWQTKKHQDLNQLLQLFATNLFGCWTISATDNLIFRTLDIEESDVPTVFEFTDSNIIRGSVTKPEFRRSNEIFQKFRIRYNYEPTEANNPNIPGGYTQEMILGWDQQLNKKIASGFSRQVADETTGTITALDGGEEDALTDRCRISSTLYAVAGRVNEAGFDRNKEIKMDFFYRPNKLDDNSGQFVEYDLPNLETIHGTNVLQPKRSMQDFFSKYLRFFVYNSWKFSFKCHMKYCIYDAGVNGLADEAGTVERKLKLMDKVSVTSSFFTGSQKLYGFVTGIQPHYYDGYATITVYVPLPPGFRGHEIDHTWDASYSTRVNTQHQFPDNSYGLTNEAGTYADATNGTRVNSDHDFPDSTYADSQGTGTGQV